MTLNPTLYGGGHSVPPPKVLVSGAFQSDLRDPRCWHNSYMIMRIDFMKKKFQNFFKIFFNFFQFFGHPSHTKRFFCTFGQKITYLLILRGQHVHLTPQKCFLEAYSTSCSQNASVLWFDYPWRIPHAKYLMICSSCMLVTIILFELLYSRIFVVPSKFNKVGCWTTLVRLDANWISLN